MHNVRRIVVSRTVFAAVVLFAFNGCSGKGIESKNSLLLLFGLAGGVNTRTLPQTNGNVNAMAQSGNILYVAGSFSRINVASGNGAVLDASTGDIPANAVSSEVDGTVYACVPEGSGGWIIGGEFFSVRGETRNYIARINADGTLHPWNPEADDAVCALAVSGGVVYAGGVFTNIGGASRNYIAAIDMTSGTATSWNPNADNGVGALAVNGSTVYVGGGFTSIGGRTRYYLCAIDINTGALY